MGSHASFRSPSGGFSGGERPTSSLSSTERSGFIAADRSLSRMAPKPIKAVTKGPDQGHPYRIPTHGKGGF